MTLKKTLADIVGKLREGRYPNEQSISQAVVLRLLNDLHWNIYDTNVVWPEYATGEGRVDFALCEPPAKPRIFIEVKQPGRAEDGVRQALEYAFHTGVPFIVLTDGKTWSFYLPAEQGSYEERRVFKLDLFERPVGESADVLQRYLEQGRVASGEALETARREYRSRSRRAVARKAIPEAWSGLVDEGDESLVELLAGSVESKVGIRPDDADVVDFLVSLREQAPGASPPARKRRAKTIESPPPPAQEKVPVSPRTKTSRSGSLVISGKAFGYTDANEAAAVVLGELQRRDPTFLQRLYRHPKNQGRKRRYVAQSGEELYPDRPDLREHCKQLPDHWLLSTNLNNHLKKTILRAAAEVAGLEFGRDVIVDP